MAHTHIRKFNTRDTYPEQKLNTDLSQGVVARGTMVFLRGQVSQDLKVLEWRSLDMRRKLAVVRWGDREHLLCLAPTGDMVVASREAPAAFKPIAPDDVIKGANSGGGSAG